VTPPIADPFVARESLLIRLSAESPTCRRHAGLVGGVPLVGGVTRRKERRSRKGQGRTACSHYIGSTGCPRRYRPTEYGGFVGAATVPPRAGEMRDQMSGNWRIPGRCPVVLFTIAGGVSVGDRCPVVPLGEMSAPPGIVVCFALVLLGNALAPSVSWRRPDGRCPAESVFARMPLTGSRSIHTLCLSL